MRNATLTVDPKDRHTVFGPKMYADRHFLDYDIALWVRASGRATLFYRDNEGKARRRTWREVRFKADGMRGVDVLNGALRELTTLQAREV